MTLSGKVSGEQKQYQTSFILPEVSERNPELERLWAFASIDALQDEVDLYGENADLKQAMVDLAVDHSLVTEHTSMIVMRDEQFAARGIARNNQKRVQKEAKARQQRVNQPVAKRRVDQPKPMFPQPRASHSGAGALDAWWFLIYAPLLLVLFRKTALVSKTVLAKSGSVKPRSARSGPAKPTPTGVSSVVLKAC